MTCWSRRGYRIALIASTIVFLYYVSDGNHFHATNLDEADKEIYPNTIASQLLVSFPVSSSSSTRLKVDKKHINEHSTNGLRQLYQSNNLLYLKDFRYLTNPSHTCNTLSSSSSSSSSLSSSSAGTATGPGLSGNFSAREDNRINLITFIHSSPSNFEKRRVLRSTWASKEIERLLNIRFVYLIGSVPDSDQNATLVQSLIDKESRQYRDIVQGNFIDTYRNLTLKHLMGFKWVLGYCSNTKFVMKADDDAFIDVYRVIDLLLNTFRSAYQTRRALLACSLFPEGTPVKRTGKWSLTEKEYKANTFPAYCSGIAYLATPEMIRQLYLTSSTVEPMIWIDDLFITGLVADRLKSLHHQSLNTMYTYSSSQLRRWLRKDNVQRSADNNKYARQTAAKSSPPYMVADIGHVSDWKSLMYQVWLKTYLYWKNKKLIIS